MNLAVVTEAGPDYVRVQVGGTEVAYWHRDEWLADGQAAVAACEALTLAHRNPEALLERLGYAVVSGEVVGPTNHGTGGVEA